MSCSRHPQSVSPYQSTEKKSRCGGNRGCRNEKKKLGVSNTPYNGGRWITDGSWWVTDGGWCVTDGGWWVATKHQRVDAIVKKGGGG